MKNSVKMFSLAVCLIFMSFAFTFLSLRAACAWKPARFSGQKQGEICSWGRGDGRCNSDNDCCYGMECDSQGFCQLCR